MQRETAQTNLLRVFPDGNFTPSLLRYFSQSFFNFTIVFSNPILNNFKGTIVTASTGLNHIDINYCKFSNIKVLSLTKDYDLINNLPDTVKIISNFAVVLILARSLPPPGSVMASAVIVSPETI